MNFDSAWRIVSLALSLVGCMAAWVACALSGGDLLECVLKGIVFFVMLWVVFCILGSLLRAFMLGGKEEQK